MKKLLTILAAGMLITMMGLGSAQADFTWQTQPILGHSVSDATGDVVVTTDAGQVTIPHVNLPGDLLYGVGLPGVSQFYFNPDTFTGGHWTDTVTTVAMGSGVYLNAGTTYTWTSTWSFLGTPGNSAYNLTDTGIYDQGQTYVMLMSYINNFWLEDAGNWQYTQGWTDNASGGLSITSTPVDFTLTAVPLPPTALLLAPGLLGLGLLRLRKRTKA